MTAQLVIPRAVDGNDDPVSGALLIIYNEGTSTPQTTYTDSGLGTPNSNPLVADANGDFTPAWITANTARAVIRNAADTLTLWEKDPCPAGSGTADNATEVPFTPITGNGADDVAEAIGNNTGSILTLEESVENATRLATTAGTTNAFTLASINPVSAYASGQMWLVQFHIATSSNCTLSIDGLPAQALKQYDSASKINMAGGTLQNNSVTRIIFDGTDLVALDARATGTHPGLVEMLDEDDMASDSSVRTATQQSIKAYVDARTTSYTDESGNRVAGTAYENTSSNELLVSVGFDDTGTGARSLQISETGSGGWSSFMTAAGDNAPGMMIVPAGWFYRMQLGYGFTYWLERENV